MRIRIPRDFKWRKRRKDIGPVSSVSDTLTRYIDSTVTDSDVSRTIRGKLVGFKMIGTYYLEIELSEIRITPSIPGFESSTSMKIYHHLEGASCNITVDGSFAINRRTGDPATTWYTRFTW